jgi:DNA-binding NtrC family response regulator
MATEHDRPLILIVDDDRAVLSLMGTGVSCLEVLRALRRVSPQCEAVLTTGYDTVEAAIEALREKVGGAEAADRTGAGVSVPGSIVPATLLAVEREHIIRTLELVQGNKAVAARLLGMSRRALYRLLERHGLHRRVPVTRGAKGAENRVDGTQ